MTNKNQLTGDHPVYAEPYLEDAPPAPDYEADARHATWDEAHRRLANAEALKRKLDQVGDYVIATRASVESKAAAITAAQEELSGLRNQLAEAEGTEAENRLEYNRLRGTGKAMRQMVIDECAVKGVPIPQDPEPAGPSAGVMLAASCDHVKCRGCLECGCHAAMSQMAEPVTEHPVGGVL
jgi:hypothetical protein